MIKKELKIEGGKFVRCKMEIEGGKIERIVVNGDFFLYPEASINQLESELKGLKIADVDSIEKTISKFFEKVEAIGITREDLVKIICSQEEMNGEC